MFRMESLILLTSAVEDSQHPGVCRSEAKMLWDFPHRGHIEDEDPSVEKLLVD